MTGPVRVKGAKPGDILKVEILTTEPWSSWGWNTIRKGKGALGEFFIYLFIYSSFISVHVGNWTDVVSYTL